MAHTYPYPRPSVTVDCAIFRRTDASTSILLIQRKHDPFAGKWAFPGGFVNENEPLEVAAARELKEETGIVAGKLEQIGAFGDPSRDPRGWTVTVAFVGSIDAQAQRPVAADDAADAKWFEIDALPPLAFDHDKIISLAIAKELAHARKGVDTR